MVKRQIGDEWESKNIKWNLGTLIIEKRKVSYRGYKTYDNEFTGSSTGDFNLSGNKLIIPQSLKKYMTKGQNRFSGEPQLKIKLPKGKYMKLVIISTTHKYAAWERTIGTSTLKVLVQSKKKIVK